MRVLLYKITTCQLKGVLFNYVYVINYQLKIKLTSDALTVNCAYSLLRLHNAISVPTVSNI